MLILVPSFMIVWISIGIVRQIFQIRKNITSIPSSISWAGRRREPFSRIRACLRELVKGLQTLQSGYDNFGRFGKLFVIPDVGLRPQVMIPQKDLSWFVEQPETSVNARKPQVGRFAIDMLAPFLTTTHDGYLVEMIRKDFTRNMAKTQPAIIKDLRIGLKDNLDSNDDNWKEVNLWETMQTIIFRSTLQMFVGQRLAEHATFRSSIASFAKWLGVGAVIVGQLSPPLLKPLLGYCFAVPIFIAQRLAMRELTPEVKFRMDNLKRKRADPCFKWEEPKDLMMFMVKASLDKKDEEFCKPSALSQRVLFLSLGALHTTIMTATNIMLDLLSSPPECQYLETLRREADENFQQPSDWDDHARVGKLVYADSTLRETLRKTPVLTRVVLREIVVKEGLTFPGGEHLPNGTWVGIPSAPVHHDEAFYPRPELYDPFRFVQEEEHESEENNKQDAEKTGAGGDARSKVRKLTGASTISDTYLAYGYGRHSCPGRWFVTMQLKLFLAMLVCRYDFKRLEHRPLNSVFGDSLVPCTKTTIMVRNRQLGAEKV